MEQLTNLKVNISEKQAYSYDILVGNSLLQEAENYIKKYTLANKFLIVTNETVASLYKNALNIKNSEWLILKDGEEYKNFETYELILDKAIELKLERKDCLIAFGGGVVGDITGFAASTYMRGCDFIQIPTTLLAQVDSSVGGKVAINHAHGKNLIGAFYQPKLVLSDISVLKTLDLRQLKTGLAEVLKYAFLEKSSGSPLNYRLFDFLKQNKDDILNLNPSVMIQLVNICCSIKSYVVNQDETEKGLRAILNLGHTFAHAVENITNYKTYTHGEAVAIGIKSAFELALKKELISKNYYENAMQLINDYEILLQTPTFDKEVFYKEMFLDKKAQNGKIRFVLPNGDYTVCISSDLAKNEILSVI